MDLQKIAKLKYWREKFVNLESRFVHKIPKPLILEFENIWTRIEEAKIWPLQAKKKHHNRLLMIKNIKYPKNMLCF